MITLLLLIFILLKAIEFIYPYQIKEYRWDRLYSSIKESGIISVLYLTKLSLPAKSPRNSLIVLCILGMIVLLTPLILALPVITKLLLILLSPVIGFIITSVAVHITGILATYQRRTIILKAQKLISTSSVICIGVTGSYGKTSVKEFLYSILSSKYQVAKTDKNMNTDVGIALSILKNLKPDTKYFIVEFGAYRLNEIKKETDIITPQYSILSGLGNQHLDLYGSLQNLVDEETYILQILKPNDRAYINLDFPQSREHTHNVKSKKIYYSINQPTDISVQELNHTDRTVSAEVKYKDHRFTINTELFGKHTILNLLPCIGLALDLGMTEQEISVAIKKIKPIPGKLSAHSSKFGALVLNDSYNSNVDGFIAALETAEELPQSNKYIVTKGIIELGVEKRASYKRIIKSLNKTAVKLITTDKLFKDLDIENRVKLLNDVVDIGNYLSTLLNKDSLLVVEGRFPKKFIERIIGNSI